MGVAKNKQGGFSLIEVLVAVVVLSVGLLGLAGLQTNSLRNNHSAYLRTQGAVLVGDIIERMRANYNAAVTGGRYNLAYAASVTAAGCSTACTDSQVAADDLARWRTYVEQLPGGESQVNVTAAGVATVSVRWSDTRNSDNKLEYQMVTTL